MPLEKLTIYLKREISAANLEKRKEHIMGFTMKPWELIKFLEANGYSFIRAKGGSHHIYSNGANSIPIPIHGSKDFGEDFIRMILKEKGISKSYLIKYLDR